jgi:hypothetical protein
MRSATRTLNATLLRTIKLTLITLVSFKSFSQDGGLMLITGQVNDAVKGSPLPDVSVQVQGIFN